MSKPSFDGLVRSNFWKGRQRLNRLYRWIANVVRPKIDLGILCEGSPQNNPEVSVFLQPPVLRSQALTAHQHILAMRDGTLGRAYLRRNWPRGGAPRGAPPP